MNSLASALTLFASARYIQNYFYFVLVFPSTLCIKIGAHKNSFVGVFCNVKLICAIQFHFPLSVPLKPISRSSSAIKTFANGAVIERKHWQR